MTMSILTSNGSNVSATPDSKHLLFFKTGTGNTLGVCFATLARCSNATSRRGAPTSSLPSSLPFPCRPEVQKSCATPKPEYRSTDGAVELGQTAHITPEAVPEFKYFARWRLPPAGPCGRRTLAIRRQSRGCLIPVDEVRKSDEMSMMERLRPSFSSVAIVHAGR